MRYEKMDKFCPATTKNSVAMGKPLSFSIMFRGCNSQPGLNMHEEFKAREVAG